MKSARADCCTCKRHLISSNGVNTNGTTAPEPAPHIASDNHGNSSSGVFCKNDLNMPYEVNKSEFSAIEPTKGEDIPL